MKRTGPAGKKIVKITDTRSLDNPNTQTVITQITKPASPAPKKS